MLNMAEVHLMLQSMGFDPGSGYVQGVLATFDRDHSQGLEPG